MMRTKSLFFELIRLSIIVLIYPGSAFTFQIKTTGLIKQIPISSLNPVEREGRGNTQNGMSMADDDGDICNIPTIPNAVITRRIAFLSAVASGNILSNMNTIVANANENIPSPVTKIPISASWKAVDGLNTLDQNKKLVAFDGPAYKAMVNDPSRTPLFEKAIINRLNSAPGGPESQTVLDLGTGPFAVFAVMAAEAGAGKVYAIEANAEVAASARATIKKLGLTDIITVLEGFSSDITLPQKADFAIAELVGSIASEEGAYATILDAHTRMMKEPDSPTSWIPNRIQTYAAPASYTLHNLFQPPSFDWNKLNGEPVRFNCRDEALQLLANPILLEDITFSDIRSNKPLGKRDIKFTIDGERMEDNTLVFYEELRKARLEKSEAEDVAKKTGQSFSGIAFWPRLLLDADEKIEVNSRVYPTGKHQKSHWQTVLPIMSDVPVANLKGGDEIVISVDFDIGSDILKPPSYRLNGNVIMYN